MVSNASGRDGHAMELSGLDWSCSSLVWRATRWFCSVIRRLNILAPAQNVGELPPPLQFK